MLNPGGPFLRAEQTAAIPRFHLFVYQKPGLLISEPFILFMEEENKPGMIRIRATIRNSCHSEKWIYTRGTTVHDVAVRFYNGNPDHEGKQIGTDQVIPEILPIGFASADVLWDLSGVAPGKHMIWVVVDPEKKIVERNMNMPDRVSKVYEVR